MPFRPGAPLLLPLLFLLLFLILTVLLLPLLFLLLFLLLLLLLLTLFVPLLLLSSSFIITCDRALGGFRAARARVRKQLERVGARVVVWGQTAAG